MTLSLLAAPANPEAHQTQSRLGPFAKRAHEKLLSLCPKEISSSTPIRCLSVLMVALITNPDRPIANENQSFVGSSDFKSGAFGFQKFSKRRPIGEPDMVALGKLSFSEMTSSGARAFLSNGLDWR